jgi:hypothetical protein
MATGPGTRLRRRAAATLVRRPPAGPPRSGPDAVSQAVTRGVEWAVDGAGPEEDERRLATVEPELRGFAYEGAAMAYTILDVLPGGGRDRTRRLLDGPGRPHLVPVHLGIGAALARLPHRLWRRILPDLADPDHCPLSWLAVDGYGFELAYAHLRRCLVEQRVPAAYPWPGAQAYVPRVVDQGIGRALWFVHAGVAEQAGAAVLRFRPDRQPDLWRGIGFAATYAGGTRPAGLALLAGPHRAELGTGAVLAAKARTDAGVVPAHTEQAARALAGLPVAAAAALADEATRMGDEPGPAYERWREHVRANLPAALRPTA